MSDPKRLFDIDYARILAKKLQTVPAWRDMAKACNEILGQEVDSRRRRLEKIRDSVQYRRGDTLSNFNYNPDPDKPALSEITKTVVDIPENYFIKKGIVRNVIRNLVLYSNPDGTDYLDLSFTYNDEPCRWLKPINITQERDALLKNSYIMGFDFFNTKLGDEDLQRLYETVQQYWPESGSDNNFIKFIGFIKNVRFDLVALWTEDTPEHPSDDPNNEYPYLKPFDSTMKSVTEGGNNWQTNHVEITYDLAQFSGFYTINLEDMEQLFYYFAPIILVLERITGTLTVDNPIYGINLSSITSYQYGSVKPITEFMLQLFNLNLFEITSYNTGTANTKSDKHLGLQGTLSFTDNIVDPIPALIAVGAI